MIKDNNRIGRSGVSIPFVINPQSFITVSVTWIPRQSDRNWTRTDEWLANVSVPRCRELGRPGDICYLFPARPWWRLIVRPAVCHIPRIHVKEWVVKVRTVYRCDVERPFDILVWSRLITVPVSGSNVPCHRFHYWNSLDHAFAPTFAKTDLSMSSAEFDDRSSGKDATLTYITHAGNTLRKRSLADQHFNFCEIALFTGRFPEISLTFLSDSCQLNIYDFARRLCIKTNE